MEVKCWTICQMTFPVFLRPARSSEQGTANSDSPAGYPAGLIQGRNTYGDFVCSQRSGIGKTHNVAIEADSSNKRFSLEKPVEMERRGFQCIWVRWNCPTRIIPHPNIHLIDLYPVDEPLEPQ